MTALHEDAMREAIAADGDAQRALLAGERRARAAAARGRAYRASWEAAPPRSFGRLVGYAKASILAGENPAPYVREQLGDEATRRPPAWALALAALSRTATTTRRRAPPRGCAPARTRSAAPPDAVTALAAARPRGVRGGRAARSSTTSRRREEHLTGVPIADTALVLDRLAERRLHGRAPALAAAAAGRRRARDPDRHAHVGGGRLLARPEPRLAPHRRACSSAAATG